MKFILLLAISVMGADMIDTVIHCYGDCVSFTIDSMPIQIDTTHMSYHFENPQIEITADHSIILDSVPGIGLVHPGDCFTVDSNQVLISCPLLPLCTKNCHHNKGTK